MLLITTPDPYALSGHGHCEAGAPGRDIVCAAASCLLDAYAARLQELDIPLRLRQGPGLLEIRPRPALADGLLPQARREDHERAPGRRDHGRLQQHRRLCQEARRHPQDGRSQQGFRTFPLVKKEHFHAETVLS